MSKKGIFIQFAVACLVSAFICVFLSCGEDSNDTALPATNAITQVKQMETQEDDVQGSTIVMNESDNGSTKTIHVGDILQIELGGNPTTGYEWGVGSYDASILEQVGVREYEQDPQPDPDHPVAGLGGTFTFRFKGAVTGQTLLRLIYHRTWENKPPYDLFELTVIVQ